jgi:hypothetical protein
MKSAITNCVSNGVTSLLGLKNLTWIQLKEAGIEKEQTTTVKYAAGGAGGGLISEAQGKRLFAIMQSMRCDETAFRAWLKENYKIDSTKDIQKKDYEAICNHVEGK